jgi:BirA family biotin operon repressor/biotin-[acetyl-CoA-carboxylase] ligase
MKTEILKVLHNNRSSYISGEELSKKLNVSRTAIWKTINQLRSEGYEIDSSPHKGYQLVNQTCDLNQSELEIALGSSDLISKIVYLTTVDSTNHYAKQLGNESVFEPSLIIAEEQTRGRGRLGREWSSEDKSGIWMSLLLKPDIQPTLAARITLMAAAAISSAIDDITGLETKIKWPNDIVIEGKKVCGILTEMSAELNHINYLVLGIGVNVNQSHFNEEITSKATSLYNVSEVRYNRLDIVVSFMKHFSYYYKRLIEQADFSEVIQMNRKKSITLN